MHRRGHCLLSLAALGVLLSAGCTVSLDGPPERPLVAPLVRDERAEIDLRTLPTREDLGLPPGTNSQVTSRERGSEGIRLHLVPSSGQPVDLLAFGVAAGNEQS